MKTKINTHSTSHCQDVRGYVQNAIFLVMSPIKLIFKVYVR